MLLETAARHETVHGIDQQLGTYHDGQAHSITEEFRQCVLQDQANAKQRGLWPDRDDDIEGALMRGISIHHYFPEEFTTDTHFTEAFAEIGAALYGGGAVPSKYKLVERLYPSATEWVKRVVFEPFEKTSQSA